jgi:site-specific DNA-methyltransferase (adenine-specific)
MPGYSAKTAEEGNCFGDGLSNGEAKCSITAPATEAARQWRGWGTALKPALEPITMARKPLAGTVAGNVLEHGTGAMNIDGCRVAHQEDCRMMAPSQANIDNPSEKHRQAGRREAVLELKPEGRWPANLIHDGSEEVVALFPDKAGASAPVRGAEASAASVGNVTGERARVPGAFHGDAGSAARFFYCAKASRDDRNEGTESLEQRVGGMVSNTSGQHITRRDEGYEPKPQGNNHPTVKPTDLMRYLCRLVTPAGGLVLDPFAGSGSTGKAAVLEGFEFVGIEREAAYVEIARTRIAHAQALRSAQTIDLFGEAA